MSDRTKQVQLFARLARDYPALKDWLEEQLREQVEVLVANPHEHVLRQAQGNAQRLRMMLKLLEESPGIAGR
jgi:hypothetical protein